jgi:undecaprenyl-diphosphatase
MGVPMMTTTRHTAFLAAIKVLPPKGLNTSIYLDINRFARRTAWAHSFMHAYALWLGAVLLVAIFVVAYGIIWWRRDRHAAALMGLSGVGTLIALGFNQIVGHVAKELRPYDTLHHVLVLVPRANDYAFPSDHAVVAGALVASILLVSRRAAPSNRRGQFVPDMLALGVLGAAFGLLLCFARVYVGAHYPGDVVAGFLLGAIVVIVVSLARPVAYRIADAIEPTPLGILVRRAPAMRESSSDG